MQALSERFEMRLDQETLREIEAWRARQADVPSRAEAIRRLVDLALRSGERKPLHFSAGETLTLHMLCEIHKALKIRQGIDADFVTNALAGGHLWALSWQMPGIVHDYTDSGDAVRETADILEMWQFIEEGYEKLDKDGKKRVVEIAGDLGKDVAFHGFDGNNETEHLGVARFFVNQMGRFERFKRRDLNSHMPSLDAYKRMLYVWRSTRMNLSGGRLDAAAIGKLLAARIHPENRKR